MLLFFGRISFHVATSMQAPGPLPVAGPPVIGPPLPHMSLPHGSQPAFIESFQHDGMPLQPPEAS